MLINFLEIAAKTLSCTNFVLSEGSQAQSNWVREYSSWACGRFITSNMSHACMHKCFHRKKIKSSVCLILCNISLICHWEKKKKKKVAHLDFILPNFLSQKLNLNLVQEFEGIGNTCGIIGFGSKFQIDPPSSNIMYT